jgi:predicted Zn-dependent protease
MLRKNYRRAQKLFVWLMAVAVFSMPIAVFGQTRIKAPSNRYSVADDVQAGRQAAQEVERQLPILQDSVVQNYVESVGRRLVNAIPAEFQHPQFRYTFKVVNARDINAFALPGGPMYVNRGMIEAADSEGEMAGVMAHEISHVALRHGTAQATKAQKFQWGAIAGAIAGAVIGGPIGSVVGQGSQIAIGTYFLKYSRDYERQADILGAQIMARAGYDPRDLANMFRKIQQRGGSGGPEWLSSHPDPGNRYNLIMQEAQLLRVSNNAGQDSRQFRGIKERLTGMSAAQSMQEISQSGQQYPSGESTGNGGTYSSSVEYPSARYRTYTGGNLFRVSVPSNWRELAEGDRNSITFAPEGGYGQQGITHGIKIGAAQASSRSLQQATEAYTESLLQSNPYLRQQSGYTRGTLGGRTALATQFSGRSSVTGRNEIVTMYTTQMRDGNLLYFITVVPQAEASRYSGVFNNIMRTFQVTA